VLLRPFGWPEAVWAVAGAALLCGVGLLDAGAALAAVARGADVYLFLGGMMLVSELARSEGLFDYLAARAARIAAGSAQRLFLLVYAVGTLVTVFMSNDATAVVLTPAVIAVTRTVGARQPLPYLFACAMIANAASFVLPISNPANLVIFGAHMPPLPEWLQRFALPSLASIVVTYAVLRLTQRAALAGSVAHDVAPPALTRSGGVAAAGIAVMVVVLLAASALDRPLGWPTCVTGALAFAAVALTRREAPWRTLREISWSVLPLVAGLFVLVEGLAHTGVVAALARGLQHWSAAAPGGAAFGAGSALAVICNAINNLPAGLIAGSALSSGPVGPDMTGALLIGVDLGPNLSVTGSLATILWLTALRREGLSVGAADFFRLGIMVMFPALFAALAVLLAQH
jgi:arsenical pump membrane protein